MNPVDPVAWPYIAIVLYASGASQRVRFTSGRAALKYAWMVREMEKESKDGRTVKVYRISGEEVSL